MSAPLALFVAVVCLSSAAPTESEPLRPQVLIVPLDDEARARVDGLYAAFSARGIDGVALRERAGVDLDVDEAAAAHASVDRVRDALVRARAALSDFDTARADLALDEGERAYFALERPHLARDVYVELLLVRADAALSAGDRARARESLRLLAAIEPERTALHAGLYPPPLVALFDEARAENASSPRVPIIVSPRPLVAGEATVFFDLRPVDRSESSSTYTIDAPAGPHVLSVVAEGARSSCERLDVEPGAPVVASPVLAALDAPTRRRAAVATLVERVDESAREPMDELAALTGATLVVALTASTTRALSVDLGLIEVRVESMEPVALSGTIVTALDDARRARALEMTSRSLADDESEELPLTPFAIGAGAVGAVVVVALVGSTIAALAWLFRPRDEPPDPPAPPVVIGCCTEGSG